MKAKYKFDRTKIIEFFTQHGENVLHFFHEQKLTPTQMINFWKTTPNACRMMLLRDCMERLSGEKVDVFNYVMKK